MAALDLLGRRWTLRILWELRDGIAPTFRELRDRCGDPSPTILNTRLHEMREARIVDDSNRLTPRGRRLLHALRPLYRWAEDWARGD
jgi:DNA-binding HxlR family transcriptional regulator